MLSVTTGDGHPLSHHPLDVATNRPKIGANVAFVCEGRTQLLNRKLCVDMATGSRGSPKNQQLTAKRGGAGWWLDLVNATLRDLLPERIEVTIKPKKLNASRGVVSGCVRETTNKPKRSKKPKPAPSG